MDIPRSELAFFSPPGEEITQRRLAATDIRVSGGNQMVVSDLSGQHYEHLDLAIQPGTNTVIIGDNVEARHELIHDLARANELETAKVQLPRNSRIEFVTPAMTDVENPEVTLRDFFLEARGIAGVEARMNELWVQAAEDPKAMDEAAKLQHAFEEAGGWEADRKINMLLQGLQIGSNEHDTIGLDTRLGDMSSGQVSKALIGRALFSRAGIVIMDDPSVHLDVASKQWLAEYIRSSEQATIIATSDMNFATEIGDRVVEILASKLTLNIGTGVSNFYDEREKLINFWIKEAERLKQDIDDLEIQIRDFFRPAGRQTDNMAQVLRAQESKLQRMKDGYEELPGRRLIEARKREPKAKTFEQATKSGREVFRLSGLRIIYFDDSTPDAEGTIIDVPELSIDRGDRLALIGRNGSGKSTLLKALAGQTEDMLTEGDLKAGASVNAGYYSPYTELPNEDTPLRLILGRHGNDPMGILSYWGFDKSAHYDTSPRDLQYRDEIARAQFALIMAQRPNVLLLDEPTSYLTPSHQEKLLRAVQGYDGTLLVVSHDPQFLAQANLQGRVVMPGATRESK